MRHPEPKERAGCRAAHRVVAAATPFRIPGHALCSSLPARGMGPRPKAPWPGSDTVTGGAPETAGQPQNPTGRPRAPLAGRCTNARAAPGLPSGRFLPAGPSSHPLQIACAADPATSGPVRAFPVTPADRPPRSDGEGRLCRPQQRYPPSGHAWSLLSPLHHVP